MVKKMEQTTVEEVEQGNEQKGDVPAIEIALDKADQETSQRSKLKSGQ